MTKKIALVGAAGRMGIEIVKTAQLNDSVEIGAAIEYEGSPLLGRDIGELASVGALGIKITSDLKTAAQSCDVILDMSLPVATKGVIEIAVATGTPLVCGTTGVTDEQLELFKTASVNLPVIHTKNFSIGIAVLSSLAAKAAEILGRDYDIEIIEKHHRKKTDAPSGTAQILADAIADSAGLNKTDYVYGREGHTGERTKDEIGIHAVRAGGIFGEHTVMFATEHERLELFHKAETRSLFALGAVRTAAFIAEAKPGFYTMAEVLGL
ncbi:MAG: 4-hydroxy-tetrahydrodipicolinate reductase [Deltaproteobacteria bacterium]|nr:4-hydroxy-tetrahydrodipicolinate reductase [Deltaproteobacteria bacterium]